MSTASIPPCATGGFLDRFKCVISNSDHLLEGAFWAGFFAWTAVDFTNALSERKKAGELPDSSAEKADKIWKANKQLFLSACSSVSSSTMIFSWVENVGLIAVGVFGSILGVIGYGGSSIASMVRLVDAWNDFCQSTIDHANAQDPLVKSDIALGFCPKMIAIAFLTCATAWGILGGLKILIGGAQLVILADLLFKYSAISFISYFASIFLVPLLAHDSKNLSPQPAGK